MKDLSKVLHSDDYIQEGCNPAPGVLILACTVGDDDEDAKNRILLSSAGSWFELPLLGYPVCSVDATPNGDAYVLDEGGALMTFRWETPRSQTSLKATKKIVENDAAEDRGPLRRVRVLGPDVLTCGSAGQLYRLAGQHFEALPLLTLKRKGLMLKDLAGTSAHDLLAVTTEGRAAHFDGSKWRLLDLPSNVGLHSVCRLDDGRYAIGGRQGTVMIGTQDQWRVVDPVEDGEEGRTYYGIASDSDSGTVLAAHLGGIDHVIGNQLCPVALRAKGKLEFVRLAQGPDGVWAMAGHTVGKVSVKRGFERAP